MARIDTNCVQFSEETHRLRTVCELVLTLIARPGRTQKAFAIAAGCAESDLSNALRGKQRFEMQWVFNQDDQFVHEFITEWRADRGLDLDRVDAIEAEEIGNVVQLLVRRGFRARRAAM